MIYVLGFNEFLLENRRMENARDFANILEKGIKPLFQKEIKKHGIETPSIDTDRWLLYYIDKDLNKGDIKYDVSYATKWNKGKDPFSDRIRIYNTGYDFVNKKIIIIFLPGFSKFFFPDKDHEWKHYINDMKTLIQHERMHDTDFKKIPQKILLDDDPNNSKFSAVGDPLGIYNSNKISKVDTKYLSDAEHFIYKLYDLKDINLVDFANIIDNDNKTAKKIVVELMGNKYKDDKAFEKFIDILAGVAASTEMHIKSPTERRALSQQIIIDFFRNGIKKKDILNIIKSSIKKTPSQVYNNILSLYGSSDPLVRPIRLEIAKQISELPEYR